MARLDRPPEAGDKGWSIAAPLIVFGLLTLGVGAFQLATGGPNGVILLLAGLTFLTGAVTAVRLTRARAASRSRRSSTRPRR